MTPYITNMKQTFLLVIGFASICLIAGCAPPSRHQNVDPVTRQKGIDKMKEAKQAAIACMMYASYHGGQYPHSLSDTASYGYPNTEYFKRIIAEYDLVYTGVTTNITKPAESIIIREKQAWQGKGGGWLKTYAFADCHSELHKSVDGTFDTWENERIIRP